MKLNSFFALLVFQVIGATIEYDLRCPVAREWRIRPRKYKCSATQYVCLLSLPDNIYRETCDGLDYSSRGSKLVFEPNFNKAKCNYNRYQPFPFSTDGSSDCVYQKSLCNAEGQFVYDKGTFRNNTSCRCDFLHGYTFVTKPRNNCYCEPSEEDCSCHKFICNDKDINCPQDVATLLNTSCSERLPEKDQSVAEKQSRLKKCMDFYNIFDKGSSLQRFSISVVVLITLIGIAVLVIYILLTDQLTIILSKGNELAIDCTEESCLECKISVPCSCLVRSIKWYKDNDTACISDRKNYDWNMKVPKLTLKTKNENVVGSYTCVVDTICVKHISGNMRVFYAKPKVTPSKTRIEIQNYSKIIELSCEIKSEYQLLSVKWYTDKPHKLNKSNTIAIGETNLYKFTISNVQESDTGSYTCVAENEKGTNTSKPIHVVYVLPKVTAKQEKIEILEGVTSALLSCEIKSEFEVSSVQWYKLTDKDRQLCPNDSKYVVSKEDNYYTLTINNFTKIDIGLYECVAINERGEGKSKHLKIVLARPMVTPSKTRIEISIHRTSIELSCKIESEYELASVQWYKDQDKDSIQCKGSEKYFRKENGSHILIIKDFIETDAGFYKCVATNEKGTTTSDPINVVWVLPIVTATKKKIIILEGATSAVLSCEIESALEVTSVQWYKITETDHKQEQKYVASENENHTLTIKKYVASKKNNHTLTINDFTKGDTGIYECMAKHERGKGQSERIQVVVAYPLVTANSNKIKVLEYGTTVELTCTVVSEYAVSSRKWYKDKDKDPIHHVNSEKYFLKTEKSHMLIIKDAIYSDIGFYEYEIKNPYGTTRSEPIQVVFAPPIITIQRNIIKIPAYGTSVELSCEIESDNKITSLQWYNNKEPINCDASEKYDYNIRDNKLHILIINNVTHIDIGFYKCEAENDNGSSKSEPILVICDVKEQQSFIERMEKRLSIEDYQFFLLFYRTNIEATEAIRKYFDKEHPHLLSQLYIQENKDQLMQLYSSCSSRKQAERNILYPPEGSPAVTSADLDLSLIILLLRYLPSGIEPPVSGFDNLPKSSEKSNEANIARVKYCQNFLRALPDCALCDTDYIRYLEILKQAITSIDY